MFTKSKIALAAAMILSAAPAALANDHEVDKWYPETPQEIRQMNRATDAFGGGNAYDSSVQKRGSSQKQLQHREN
jgi:hypothetical protein